MQSVKQECLDHFVVFGERHLRHLVREYVAYFHEERPHQALGNVPPGGSSHPGMLPDPEGAVVCREWLGGLLNHYHWAA